MCRSGILPLYFSPIEPHLEAQLICPTSAARMPSVLAIFAHPDDIEFVAAGTMLMLKAQGWDLQYFNLCNGNCGSLKTGPEETARIRLAESKSAAEVLNATFHPPICNDLELVYNVERLRQVAAVVREVQPSIVLTHSPVDYMEDHTNASRLVISASFVRGIPNFQTAPPQESYSEEVTVYHAMPHGLKTPLRQSVRAGLYVNTESVQTTKRAALAAHVSQKQWLDKTQGMDSYLETMEEGSRAVGEMSQQFRLAEGWRRHSHLGFSGTEMDPLKEALGDDCLIDSDYEESLSIH